MRSLVATTLLLLCCQLAHGGDRAVETAKLKAAAQSWRESAPRSYIFTVRYSEFVGMHGSWQQTYKVTGRRSTPICDNECDYRPRTFGSIPALFRFGEKLMGGRWNEAHVELDQTFGFPKKVYVGVKDMDDSYFLFEVVEFKAE